MPSLPVVEAFDILKYSQPVLLPGGELVVVNHLGFHRLKEALGYRIVPTIPFSAVSAL